MDRVTLRQAETHEFNKAGLHTTARCDYCCHWFSGGARVSGICGASKGPAPFTHYNDVCDVFEGSYTFNHLDKEIDPKWTQK